MPSPKHRLVAQCGDDFEVFANLPNPERVVSALFRPKNISHVPALDQSISFGLQL
jgi:hypothetical protein